MKKQFFLAITFIIIGVTIYFLFDIMLISKSNIIKSIIRNYLPDVCWALSFFFININFAKSITKYDLLINSVYVFAIGSGYECMQFYGIVKGTFDVIDIILYLLSVLLGCLIELILRRKNV